MDKEITKKQAKVETELINDMINDIQWKDWMYSSEEIVRWLKLWKPSYITIQWCKK